MTYLDVSEEEGDVQEDDEYDGDDQHLLGPPVRDLSHTRREEIVDGLDDDEAVGDRLVEHIGEHVDRSKRSNVGRPRSRDAGRGGGGGPAARANRSARRPRRARQPVSRQRSDLPRHVPKHHPRKKNGCGRPSRGERSRSLCLVSWWRTTRRALPTTRARIDAHRRRSSDDMSPLNEIQPAAAPDASPASVKPALDAPSRAGIGDRRGERRGAPPRALDGHPAQGPPRVQHLRHRRVPREELAPSRRPRDRRRPRPGRAVLPAVRRARGGFGPEGSEPSRPPRGVPRAWPQPRRRETRARGAPRRRHRRRRVRPR